jgi:hypothetical protein
MTYQPNIPASIDIISASQSDLQNNFTALNTQYAVDHVTFTAASDNGKHKKSTYIEQGADPTTAANEGAIYSKESSLTSDTQLFFRRESNGTAIEMTGLLAATNGWTRLPSGILLKWGTDSKSGNATVTFPNPANIPAFNNIYQVLLTVEDSSGTPNSFVYLKSISTTSFDVNAVQRTATSSSTATFRYLAIGD